MSFAATPPPPACSAWERSASAARSDGGGLGGLQVGVQLHQRLRIEHLGEGVDLARATGDRQPLADDPEATLHGRAHPHAGRP